MKTLRYFTALWCQPCKTFLPIVRDVVNEINDVELEIINVDNYPIEALNNNVKSLPTLLLVENVKNGYRLSNRHSGVMTKRDLTQWIGDGDE